MEIGKHSGVGSQSLPLPQGYNINSEGARSPFTRKGDFLWREGRKSEAVAVAVAVVEMEG